MQGGVGKQVIGCGHAAGAEAVAANHVSGAGVLGAALEVGSRVFGADFEDVGANAGGRGAFGMLVVVVFACGRQDAGEGGGVSCVGCRGKE